MPSNTDEFIAKIGLNGSYAIIVAFILLLFTATSFSFIYILLDQILANNPNTDLLSASTSLISVFVNGALTLAILQIYRDIRSAEEGQEKIMSQQKEMLKKQQSWREAEYQPSIHASVEFDECDGDWIFVTCHNDGVGRATALEFEVELFVTDAQYPAIEAIDGHNLTNITNISLNEMQKVEGYGELEYIEGFIPYTTGVQYVTDDGRRHPAEVAVDGGSEESFRFKVAVNNYQGPYANPGEFNPASFTDTTSRLMDPEFDYTAIGYRLKIEYSSIIKEESEEKIISSGVAELELDMSFSDLVESAVGGVSHHSVMNQQFYSAYVRY